MRDEANLFFVCPRTRFRKECHLVNYLRVVTIDKGTHELVDVEALMLRILNPVKLGPEKIVRNLEFNTNARPVASVSLPKDLIVRCGTKASESDLIATLLYHLDENGLGDAL